MSFIDLFFNNRSTTREFYENGTLKVENSFRNGKRDGVTRVFYENGRLKIEASFKNGNPHGMFREFNEDGKISAEEEYKDGQMMLQKHYNRSGELEGKVLRFYKSGELKIEAAFRNGNPDGLTKEFYEDGGVMAEEEYRNGALVRQKTYDRTGRYSEPVKEYYENGMIRSETDHNSGLYHEFYLTGGLKLEAHFNRGTPHGMIREFYENGALMAEDEYEIGALIGSRRYDRSGAILSAAGSLEEKKHPQVFDFPQTKEQLMPEAPKPDVKRSAKPRAKETPKETLKAAPPEPQKKPPVERAKEPEREAMQEPPLEIELEPASETLPSPEIKLPDIPAEEPAGEAPPGKDVHSVIEIKPWAPPQKAEADPEPEVPEQKTVSFFIQPRSAPAPETETAAADDQKADSEEEVRASVENVNQEEPENRTSYPELVSSETAPAPSGPADSAKEYYKSGKVKLEFNTVGGSNTARRKNIMRPAS